MGKDEWQRNVYLYAREVANMANLKTVADIGTGSGYKLLKDFEDMITLGYDLPPTLAKLRKKYPTKAWVLSDFEDPHPYPVDLVIASDSIEHIPNPDPYMKFILHFCSRYVVLSTPNREYAQLSQKGPPHNTAHVREWTHDELAAYVTKLGFRVLDARQSEGGA